MAPTDNALMDMFKAAKNVSDIAGGNSPERDGSDTTSPVRKKDVVTPAKGKKKPKRGQSDAMMMKFNFQKKHTVAMNKSNENSP